MWNRLLSNIAWYSIGYGILVYYGGYVCPYIDGLGVAIFARELAFIFFGGLVLRTCLGILRPYASSMDLLTFVAMASALTAYNSMHYHFPLGSGLKVAVGFLSIGFFLSIHAFLATQRIRLVEATSVHQLRGTQTSIINRIALITVVSVLLSTVTIFLVVNKDLLWLAEQPAGAVAYYRPSVLREIIFVMLALLAFLISVIISYSRNLKLLFLNQTQTLERVLAGHLDLQVPVISNDEFGHIATHTNSMIEGLREKQKIQSVFGKMVSPGIAERLLSSDHNSLGGEKIELTVLMSDVRNFTTLSESLAPEDLVRIMNRYFSVMVEIIHRHGGEVDKFIGDGILAVFGLADSTTGPQGAVEAAGEMVKAAESLSQELATELKIGLGIHAGQVIAGRIGSPDRQEYTFIGDTVNTAARLESASKEIGKEIVVSRSVFDALAPSLKEAAWQAVGSIALKGKRNAIETFALGVS